MTEAALDNGQRRRADSNRWRGPLGQKESKAALRARWKAVPIAGRIESHRVSIIDSGYARDTRLTYVYAVQEGDDGPIKIGHANSPEARLSSMQTGNPRHLRLLAAGRLPRRVEKEIHYELDEWRLSRRSEWFDPSPEVLAAVEALRAYEESA